MKYVRIGIVFGVSIFLNLCAQNNNNVSISIYKTNRDVIDMCRRSIEQEMIAINRLRVATITGLVALALYCSGRVIRDVWYPRSLPEEFLVKTDDVAEIVSRIRAIEGGVAILVKKVGVDEEIGKRDSLLRSIWGYSKELGSTILRDMLVFMALGSFPSPFKMIGEKIDCLRNHLFHPGTLNWFVRYKTELRSSLESLGKVVFDLSIAEDSVDIECDLHTTCLLTNSVIKQLNHVIAFMEYKSDSVQKESVMRSKQLGHVAHKTYEYVSHFCRNIQDMLDKKSYKKIPGLIQKLCETMQQQNRLYALYEAVNLQYI